MDLYYACPECGKTIHASIVESDSPLTCPYCTASLQPTPNAVEGNCVHRCLVCPSQELFVRKDFPQRLGVLIVVVGFTLSSIAWYQHRIYWTYAFLFATALIDVALYLFMGDVLECYHCHAQYRSVANLEEHTGFNLEIHEKHRQQSARLKAAAPTSPPTSEQSSRDAST